MILRILHTSDWHLGQHFYGKSRAKEHQQFLHWLLEQVKKHQIHAVIAAGDIFDTGTPPSYAREMYYDFIVNMHQLGCQLIVLAGNHDSAAMLTESKGMAAHLSCQVVSQVQKEVDTQIIKISHSTDGLLGVVCAVPFIRPKDIQQSFFGQSARDKQQTLRESIAAHYEKIYHAAKKIAGETVPIIATGHLTAVGASMSESVRDLYIGTLDAVPASDFPSADYIALGHIHRPQVVAKSEHIRYCGSPIPLSFDECQTQKQVNMVMFEQGKLKDITPLHIPCFQPLAAIKSDLANVTQAVEKALADKQHLLSECQTLWLDIEVASAEFLNDLTSKIEQLTDDLPIEVLRVRKARPERGTIGLYKEKVTLDELTLTDVFESKLETVETTDMTQKDRLRVLYSKTIEQLNSREEASEVKIDEAFT